MRPGLNLTQPKNGGSLILYVHFSPFGCLTTAHSPGYRCGGDTGATPLPGPP
jgi:hypothetical protein